MVHKKIISKITANKWKSAFVGLAVLVVFGFISGLVAIGGTATPAMSKEAAANKAIDYINSNLLQGQAIATLTGVSESNGLYLISLSISGKTYPSYITRDGKLLFPSVVNMAETQVPAQDATAAFDAPDSGKPNVKMFVMAFCPYGQQAESGLEPVYALLGDKITIEPHFVFYDNYRDGSAQYCMANGTICSMHGVAELNEGIRQMCIYRDYGAAKFWDYVTKVNSGCNSGNIDACWEGVAKTVSGIDVEKVKGCLKDEGVALATKEKDLNDEYGVSGSPTIFINEQLYAGGRSPEGFKQAVCSGFTTEPAECSQVLSGAGAATTAGGAGCGG